MSPDERKGEFLDFVVVLALSVVLAFLVLWLASTLNQDGSAFADLPKWLERAVSSLWAELSGAGAVVLSAWKLLLRRTRPLGWYFGWVVSGTVVMLGLVIGTANAVPRERPNEVFDLDFRVTFTSEVKDPPMLSFVAQEPVAKGSRFIVYQPQDGSYEHSIEIPRAGRFFGEFRRVVEGTQFLHTIPAGTEICLQRKVVRITGVRAVRLECTEGKGPCTTRSSDPGYLKACTTSSSAGLFDLRPAEAASPQQARAPLAPGWAVPSLTTLRRLSAREAIAYTEFALTSRPLLELTSARHVTYAIRVNGTPVYIDGWRPELLRERFDANTGLAVHFGLENLDFTGREGGYETIDVTLVFRNDEAVIRESRVRMRYVALRSTEARSVRTEDGLEAIWQAKYRTPGTRDRYTILLSTDPLATAEAAETLRAKIDGARLAVGDMPLVGVVRPPLPPNTSYGVAAGLKLTSGQVQFTFDESEATRVCRQVLVLRKQPTGAAVIPAEVYRYESELPDRSKRKRLCQEIAAAAR